jgi:Mn-dependent DtxR family transcriptional regulator
MASGRMLQTLQALSRLPSPGPAPAFTHVDVSQAILTIGDEGQIGRIELSRRLGIGEGAIRTIIKHLTQANIITIEKGGCALTRRGAQLYKSLRSRVSKISSMDARELALDKVSAAVLIRGSGHLVKRGIEQRDAAIRAGATGACTLVFQGREFLMPMSESEEWRLGQDDPLFQDLKNAFNPEEGDVVVVSSASGRALAEHGAMAAALTFMA